MFLTFVLTAGGCFWGKAFENAGYVESWEEGVDGTSIENIPYGEGTKNKIDMYLPAQRDESKSHGAFVFIHGGAWTGGNRTDMRAFAYRMAKEGYVSATIGYSLFGDKKVKDYSIFKVLDEVDAALAKLKTEAASRGYELNRVAIGGDSAGGHITALYAYSRGKDAPLPVVFITPRVAPIDFHVDAWEPVQKPEMVAGVVSVMNGGKKMLTPTEVVEPNEETEKMIDAVSPLSYLTRETAIPTLCAYGAKDPVVGRKHYAKLTARFKEFDARSFEEVDPDDKEAVVFDGLEFPNSGHMCENDTDYAVKFHGLMKKYAERYLKD